MSVNIKLSSRLPGDPEINGLDDLRDELLEDPEQIVCAIAWIKVKDIRRIIEHNPESPSEIPTVELARIEPIDVVDRVPKAITDLAAKLYEKRTGKNPLPFDQLLPERDVVYTTESASLVEDPPF